MSEPSAAQRAEYMIRQLENFIREKRTDKGLSFKTWQAMAHAELVNAYLDHERALLKTKQDRLGRRILLVSSSAMVTIGFWGTVMIADQHFGLLAAAILSGAGLTLAFIGGELGDPQDNQPISRRLAEEIFRAHPRLRRPGQEAGKNDVAETEEDQGRS